MHTREKSLREEKSRTNSKNPSFSSTLLDEIYRSIDKNEGENQGGKIGKKYNNGVGEKKKNQVGEEGMNSLRRACLIEKWMEKKVEEKILIRKPKPPLMPDFEKDSLQDNDTLFFSSTSISSVSSSGVLSSSDTEYFAAVEKTKKSCFFGSSFPKPIKTKLLSISSQQKVPPPPPSQPETEDSMKSRLDALKIYANLKNLKQPISPGARLTSFINSLFTNASSKKTKSRKSSVSNHPVYTGSEEKSRGVCKHSVYTRSEEKPATACKHAVYKGSEEKSRGADKHTNYTGSEEKSGNLKMERKSKSTQTSACSSTTSFTRLRLNKFPLPPKATLSKEVKMDDLKVEKRTDPDEEDDEGDAKSDCSSELFEIDDLVLFGKKRICEELPVYETTNLGKNRAIARGLMRQS